MSRRSPKIVIVILNWNGKKDTIECLDSLQKVDYGHFQPIVIDNGSTDDSVQDIRNAHPTTPIFQTNANLGFAAGNNPGIEWALSKHAEWILLLNNDTIVSPTLLKDFMAAAKEQPSAKILGAKIYRYHDPNRIDHCGGMWNPQAGQFESLGYNLLDDPYTCVEMQPVDTVCGAALLMHRSVPEAIGLLEPRFFLFWEETDFCYRARRAGFEVWTAPQAKVWHKVSASFTGKPHTEYFWWRSRLLWIHRNCATEEKKRLYKQVILPDLWKMARHYFLKTIARHSDKQKILRYKAGLRGTLDYFFGRFGNCPPWLLAQRKSRK